MSYVRVIPRDLFNEANLLKCYGQLYINLENFGLEHCLIHGECEDAFDILQDLSDGSLSVSNLYLTLRNKTYRFERPLNSREPYPMYMVSGAWAIEVFNDDGPFSQQMIDFLRSKDL